MARIRTIKPEFPQSETVGRLSRDARLLFIQLWTIADDDGRARAASRMLASLLYPYDDDAPGLVEGWLVELEREGCIVRYLHEGTTYLEIVNWLKHQKIDRPTKSKIPPSREGSLLPREPSRALDAVSRTLDHGPSIIEDGAGAPLPADAGHQPSAHRNGSDPAKYAFVGPKPMRVTHEQFGQWVQAFPRINLRAKLQQRADWFVSHEGVPKNWFIATSNWLSNENERARRMDPSEQPNRSELPM